MPELEWYEAIGRLLLAAGLGGLLGAEREYDGHHAGLRTHLLLALGAALFALVSVTGFDAFVADPATTNVQIDVTRVVSYIAAGVGFIGGGAIVKTHDKVTGLTTAASLWSAAAIGVAAGLGFWIGAAATAVIALVALEGLQPLSTWVADLGRRRGRQPQ